MEYNCPEQSSIMRNAISSLCMSWDALSSTASYQRRETRAFTIFKFRIQLRCKVESAQSPSKIKTNVFVGFRFRFEPFFFSHPHLLSHSKNSGGSKMPCIKGIGWRRLSKRKDHIFMIRVRKKRAWCMYERVNVTPTCLYNIFRSSSATLVSLQLLNLCDVK